MRQLSFAVLLTTLVFSIAAMTSANAAGKAKKKEGFLERHSQSGCYRRDGKHKCERQRRGGYSYSYEDSIIQDLEIKRQSGPFDSGFFFDTTSNESTYLNN